MLYSGSDEQAKLKAIEIYLRYLIRVTGDGDIPLETSLPMLAHLESVEKQLSYLKYNMQRAAFTEMLNTNVKEIKTPDWEAVLLDEPSVVKTDSQAVAEELLQRIQQSEVKRNHDIPEKAVKSIVNTTFWTVVESISLKWSKTKLKKKGINLADFSEPGTPQNKVQLTVKKK